MEKEKLFDFIMEIRHSRLFENIDDITINFRYSFHSNIIPRITLFLKDGYTVFDFEKIRKFMEKYTISTKLIGSEITFNLDGIYNK